MRELTYINLIYSITSILCFTCRIITHDNSYMFIGWLFVLLQLIVLIISTNQNKKFLKKFLKK